MLVMQNLLWKFQVWVFNCKFDFSIYFSSRAATKSNIFDHTFFRADSYIQVKQLSSSLFPLQARLFRFQNLAFISSKFKTMSMRFIMKLVLIFQTLNTLQFMAMIVISIIFTEHRSNLPIVWPFIIQHMIPLAQLSIYFFPPLLLLDA